MITIEFLKPWRHFKAGETSDAFTGGQADVLVRQRFVKLVPQVAPVDSATTATATATAVQLVEPQRISRRR